LYLVAWCRLRRDVRVFAVHRFRAVALGRERFAPRAGVSSRAALRDAFRVWRSANVYRVRVRFAVGVAEEVRERAAVGRTAVVFGPESSGLRSDELDLCHARVHIPADAAHTSLNLAQAVLLVAYEIRLAVRPQVAPLPGRVATAGEIEAVLEALKKGLLAIGYLNPANPEAILAELRRLLARSRPTPRETSLLRGMARQIAWAGERIGERHGLGG